MPVTMLEMVVVLRLMMVGVGWGVVTSESFP